MKFLSVLGRTWLDSIKFFLPPAIKLNLLFFLNAIIQAGKTLWRKKAVLLLGLGIWVSYVVSTINPIVMMDPSIIAHEWKVGILAIIMAVYVLVMVFSLYNIIRSGKSWKTLIFIVALSLWIILVAVPGFFNPSRISQTVKFLSFALILITFALLIWFLVLLIRPSVARKDLEYFSQNFLQFHRFLLIFFLILILSRSLDLIFNFFEFAGNYAPFTAFTFYFWFDSKRTPKDMILSLWRSVKMIFYNLPFALISWIVFYYSTSFSFRLLTESPLKDNNLSLIIGPFMQLIFLIVALTWYSIFYTQKSHEQYNLYFKTK